MPTKPARPRPDHGELADRTYLALRDMIVRGRLAPGTRAVESELARRLGVSRTPLRAAFARLAREGFLVPGTSGRRIEQVVASLDGDAVPELWSMMGALEGAATAGLAGLDAAERTELAAGLAEINAAIESAALARPRDADLLSDLQGRFHLALMDRLAGPRLRALYESVRPHVQRYEWAYGTHSDAPYTPSASEHRDIITAVRSGDADRLRDVLREHWQNAARRTMEMIGHGA